MWNRVTAMSTRQIATPKRAVRGAGRAAEGAGAPGEKTGVDAVIDSIHYREFKILLKPEDFLDLITDVRDYWKLVKSVARQTVVRIVEHPDPFAPELREVVFLDTPSFDLYRRSYILRRRTPYKLGKPGSAYELTFKFRNPDATKAASVDVRSAPRLGGRLKLKEELLLERELGGMRSVFSHTCQLKRQTTPHGATVAECARLFRGLSLLGLRPTTKLLPVADARIEEVMFNVGSAHFGAGLAAKMDIAIWRDPTSKKPLTGELSFEYSVEHYGSLAHKAKHRSERFYRLLQKETGVWVEFGTTKTAAVYGLSGKRVTHHE
jgi:hypothetical protein